MRAAGRWGFKSRAAALALSALVCTTGWVSWARAEGGHKTVVMLVDPSVLPLARRLRQEIESLGLTVRWLPPESMRSPAFEEGALAAGVVASIRIAPMGGGDVDLAIFDSATGKTVSWKLVAAITADPAASELIATRTVELLRASLLEMAARHSAPADEPPPEAQPLARSTHEMPKLREGAGAVSLLVAAGSLYSVGWRPGAHMLTAFTSMLLYRAGVSASILVPIAPARLSGREGSVDLFASFYRLGLVFELAGKTSPVSFRMGAGLGLGRLHFVGNALTPYVGVPDDQLAACPTLSGTARFSLAPNFSLTTDLSATTAFPRTVIRLAGREAAEWGRPAVAVTIGLELTSAGSR